MAGKKRQDIDGTLALNVDKKNKIYLARRRKFQVIDGNACDTDGALFQLPNPYPDGDLRHPAYEIYARALGKPGGGATITTCATGEGDDYILGTADDEIVCSTGENVILFRDQRKQTFTNVTKALTTITYLIATWSDRSRRCAKRSPWAFLIPLSTTTSGITKTRACGWLSSDSIRPSKTPVLGIV